jgi:formylglycine-generating enzyme
MKAPLLSPPPGFPERWASGWGQDRRGLWQSFSVGAVTQVLRWIPPGEFLMGSPADEPERWMDRDDYDETQHQVILTEGFWLAETACTQALWQAVLNETPSRFLGAELPVEQVSWTDVTERFLPALNRLVPGLEARLSTEARWEYACRAGTETPFSFGRAITTGQVNYNGNYPYPGGAKDEYREKTVETKALPANDWGLYQMHGNVWEWCADWVGPYPAETVTDPAGPSEGRGRVVRGGGWINRARSCRSSRRFGYGPGHRHGGLGFRLSRGPSPRPVGHV